MKTAVKKLDSTKRQLSVEVSGDRVKTKFEDVLKEVSKEAKLPGFRQGNAPRDMIEKNFSAHIHERVAKELISDIYSEAVSKEGLDVVELPEITDVKLERTLLSFTATVSVSPEVAVKNYKGIKVSYKTPVVTEDEVKRHLDSVKEKKKVDSLDDAYARGLGYPTLSALKESVQRQLLSQKEHAERQKAEQQILDAVMKDQTFHIPESLIHRQLHDLMRQTKVDLAMRGVSREKIEAEEKNLEKELRPQAEKQVRMYLVLAEVAKKENIKTDDHMAHTVMEMLLRDAHWDVS